jgi:hypothetical protein
MGMGGFMGAATRTRSSARASRSDQGASGSIGTGKRWKREGGCLTRHRHSTSSRGSALGEDWRRLSILTRNMRQASLSVVYPLAAQRRGTAAPAWSQLDWPRKVSSERWDSHHKGIKGRWGWPGQEMRDPGGVGVLEAGVWRPWLIATWCF